MGSEEKGENLENTMRQNYQESRCEYWATRLSVHLFAHTAHSFACSALLATLAHFAHFLDCGTVNDWMAIFSVSFSFLDHSAESGSEDKEA